MRRRPHWVKGEDGYAPGCVWGTQNPPGTEWAGEGWDSRWRRQVWIQMVETFLLQKTVKTWRANKTKARRILLLRKELRLDWVEKPRNKDTRAKPSAPAQAESLGKAERLGKGGVRCGHKMGRRKEKHVRKLGRLQNIWCINTDQAPWEPLCVFFN